MLVARPIFSKTVLPSLGLHGRLLRELEAMAKEAKTSLGRLLPLGLTCDGGVSKERIASAGGVDGWLSGVSQNI
jgi:hypothetical protein